jgi:hypothetical protein
MNEPNYSPIKEFTSGWWSDKVKPFLDFKSYLAQRRRILADPNVMLTTPIDDKTWKSPLKFATQGLVIPSLLASLVISVFFFFARQPEPPWKDGQREFAEAVTKLRDLEAQMKASSPFEQFYFGDNFVNLSRDEAVKECQQRIAKLEARQWVFVAAPYVDDAEKKLAKFVSPTFLILAAYFFRWSLKFGQGRSGSNIHRAHEVYLYFVTSSIFWISLIYNVFLVLLFLSVRTESVLVPVFYGCCMVLGFIAMVLVNRDCKKLQDVFNLPLLEGKGRRTSGHNKIFSTIFYANLLSLVTAGMLLFVAAWMWGILAMWISRFHA